MSSPTGITVGHVVDVLHTIVQLELDEILYHGAPAAMRRACDGLRSADGRVKAHVAIRRPGWDDGRSKAMLEVVVVGVEPNPVVFDMSDIDQQLRQLPPPPLLGLSFRPPLWRRHRRRC